MLQKLQLCKPECELPSSLVNHIRAKRFFRMPSMDAAYHSQGPLLLPPVFSAPPLSYDSLPMYGAATVPPPPPPPPNPPPKWGQANRQSWKRKNFNAKTNGKRNNRAPSAKVNIKRLQQQNAKGARKHFQGTLALTLCPALPFFFEPPENAWCCCSSNSCHSSQCSACTLQLQQLLMSSSR